MSRRRSYTQGANIWPGFVDGLSTLLLVLMFVLSIFVVAQFYLGEQLTRNQQLISEQDDALTRLRAELARLSNDLSLARAEAASLSEDNAALQLDLEVLQDTIAEKDAQIASLGSSVAASAEELEVERALSEEQKAEIATLNAQLAALRRQLASLQEALEAAEAKDVEQQAQIENLSQRLNAALARRVNELARVRSDFLEQLAAALEGRPGFRRDGDRYIVEGDVLFGSCSTELTPAARDVLRTVAAAINDVRRDLDTDYEWVLRVDGHADQVPLGAACRALFDSNLQLSTRRALSVVEFLSSQGVPADRLVAAGFGDAYPLVAGRDPASLAQNRRIEFKLTER
ncbi:flagellar motor protein [Parvularcula bermudensis HTCC2503]|uniref:Flagellar motor protein n=1 Tax=Parvularcula bermudensis (strain ATCC BAA-594 / HTCC2503 / KCTC 12087) TaxID=314260 RepID=E0TBS2_PARBH|nr:peptidoglycan -binding protein [Parvularcula bermudensis]ADM08415.1 flagellar motor protein [Parvularcula bermudensis HTCC2503]